jgi:DNA-binding HxlR family transcriptional regulator
MREVFARLGDKRSALLMHLLRTGNDRHALLRRLVGAVGIEAHISQRMLTLRLRSLERDGLIARRMIETHPPGVEYVLTPLGHALTERLEHLMQWIREHQQKIRDAREQFDQAGADETPPLNP